MNKTVLTGIRLNCHKLKYWPNRLSWLSLLTMLSLLSGLSLLSTSCEEDVNVFAPEKFIPVVYCLLDPADSVQTVRVSRVFQDRKQLSEWENTFDRYLADSSNRIYIEQIGNNGKRIKWNFDYSKQIRSGSDTVFACTNLFTAVFKPGYSEEYQLYVYFPETKTMASAKIRTLARVSLIDPAIVPGRKLVIDPTQAYVIRWNSAPGTAYFQGIFHINYMEKDAEQITGKTVSMPLRAVLQYPDKTLISQNVSGLHLLQTLAELIPVRDGVRRKLTGFDFTFYYGGTELALFANSGMNPKGSEGMVVDFSNLDNARGIFSSLSYQRVIGILLSDQTQDTIALSPLTKNLNFLLCHEDL